MGKLHRLVFEQRFPAKREDVWDFLSNPVNLKVITPPSMSFEVLTNLEEKIYEGQIIEYNVSPIAGVKLKWVTEITHVKEGEYFVDEQKYGPYRIWHHKHFLHSIENGVEMKDVVDYMIPFGIIGEVAHKLFVKKQLIEIFGYRFSKLEYFFGKY